MLQLGKRAQTAGGHLGHIDQAANLAKHHAATGVVHLGVEDIDGHVRVFLIEVSAPDQQALLARSQRCLDRQAATQHAGVLHGLIHIGTPHGNSPRIKRCESREKVTVVKLRRQGAACQVLVLVIQTQHGVLDPVLVGQLQALDGLGRCCTRRQTTYRRV